MIRFGPAGNSPLFYEEGGKESSQVPAWLHRLGLNAYEYQCTHGVRISRPKAEAIGAQATEYGIALSLHAPYYINLATEDTGKKRNTIGYLLQSLEAARWMGAQTVVFHPGSVGKKGRPAAMDRARATFTELLSAAADRGFSDIILAPETCGKQNQLGTLAEVLELCYLSPQVRPTIDFAHLHALSGGAFTTKPVFARILDEIEKALGKTIVQRLHIHFSPINFTAGGEKSHSSLLETEHSPDFSYLAELILERGLEPTIICESSERQVSDVLIYRDLLLELKNKHTSQ